MKRMDVIKCINGHFYDGQKYEFCPHCGAIAQKEGSKDSVPSIKSEEKKKNSIFGRRKKYSAKSQTANETFGVFDDVEEDAAPAINEIKKSANVKEDIHVQKETERIDPPSSKEQSQKVHFEIHETSNEFGVSTNSDNSERSIANAGDNDGKTFGFFHIDNGEQEESINSVSEPVVGWIVCVKGKHLGESFNVFAGRNSIGRGINNMIVISKDPQISREKHAFITYEPKKRVFFISSGDSSGLTYINEEMVDASTQLNNYDIIEMGKSQFVFVSLCGEKFSWDQYF